MALIEWQDGLSVGIAEFDHDHQKLIQLINTLWDANTNRRLSVIGPTLDELVQYVHTHFQREEDFFAKTKFTGRDDHIQRHRWLQAEVKKLVDAYRSGSNTVLTDTVFDFLRDWLIKHILGEDMIYAAYFRILGLTSTQQTAAEPVSGATDGLLFAALAVGLAGAGLGLAGFTVTGPIVSAASVVACAVIAGTGYVRPRRHLEEGLRRLSVRVGEMPLGPSGALGRAAFFLRVLARQTIDQQSQRGKSEDVMREAEKDVRGTLLRMSDELEQTIGGTVTDVTTRSDHLCAIAMTMREQASSVGERNRAVAEAAQCATSNVNAVASSAAVLLRSIQEMQAETEQSRKVAEDASAESERTTTIVSGLAEASQQIGDIVGLIDTIARQTNMLALNATIEAARAGDAGKGFAVVAHEVKGLANQTTEATGRIRSLVDTIQSAVEDAVGAISRVDDVVSRISALSVAMAETTAVQAESAAVISEKANQVAQETIVVTSTIAKISETATETEQMSSLVLNTVGGTAVEVRKLRDRLIGALRGSYAGNRRQFERFTLDSGAIVLANGVRHAGHLHDISAGGALIELKDFTAAPGLAIRFMVDGFGEEIPAHVVRISDKGCHLRFEDDEARRHRLAGWLAMAASGPAAEGSSENPMDIGNDAELF